MIVVGIWDEIAGDFVHVFAVANAPSAVRMFKDEINRPVENNMLYKHPEDYSLWKLADVKLREVVSANELLVQATSLVESRSYGGSDPEVNNASQ